MRTSIFGMVVALATIAITSCQREPASDLQSQLTKAARLSLTGLDSPVLSVAVANVDKDHAGDAIGSSDSEIAPGNQKEGDNSTNSDEAKPGDGIKAEQPQGDGDESPLLLDDEPPLLLDDDPLLLDNEEADSSNKRRPTADNSRCHVCHLDFAAEKIAAIHARKNIGCADCHGACDGHIDDESWASGEAATAPDVMYPREQIDPACEKCHHAHDAPASEVVRRWQERCAKRTNPSDIVCTDCHGQHRIDTKLRKAWWDKKTGKPIVPPKTSGNASPK